MNTSNTFNTPNFVGELFTADATRTPLLSLIGDLSGGFYTDNEEFPTAVLFDYPEAKQPEISETEAAAGVIKTYTPKIQETNVVQIFQEAVSVTYQRLSNTGRLAGVTTLSPEKIENEIDFQIAQKLKVIARDVEYTFINGKYNKRKDADTPNGTRGLIELCTGNNHIEANGEALSKEMLQELYKMMADNGAYFDNMVIFVNSDQKVALSEIYSAAATIFRPVPMEKAGVNVLEIDNDFFKCGVVYNKFVPRDTLLICDIAHIAPVFQTVPGKGNLFVEELAKVGAANEHQLYGQIGLAHGAGFLHGVISGLK